jgi:hypothetical protein
LCEPRIRPPTVVTDSGRRGAIDKTNQPVVITHWSLKHVVAN